MNERSKTTNRVAEKLIDEKKGKDKGFPYCPELIPVYRQSARR